LGTFHSKRSSYASIYSNIFIFMTVTNNIYQKQIKYHVFNAVTNSELTELVPVFTIRPAFPTSDKKVNTSFKNVWGTWVPALSMLLADLMIFCPLGPMNFKNSVYKTLSIHVMNQNIKEVRTSYWFHEMRAKTWKNYMYLY
jgi:hypothetical protein